LFRDRINSILHFGSFIKRKEKLLRTPRKPVILKPPKYILEVSNKLKSFCMQKDPGPFLTKQDFDKPLAWIYFKNNQPKIGVYRNPPYFTQTSYSS
jgi:hypothetical protein